MDENQVLELVEFYEDMIEKQDEIIVRQSRFIKSLATELSHLRNMLNVEATPFDRGAWHVGVNYGGGLFGICNNHNSIGIEMCVQAGYNYEKAFQNTVEICKMLMKKFGIDANHVVSHYDVCAKNCPSAIRAKGDWNRFKQLIGAKTANNLYQIPYLCNLAIQFQHNG